MPGIAPEVEPVVDCAPDMSMPGMEDMSWAAWGSDVGLAFALPVAGFFNGDFAGAAFVGDVFLADVFLAVDFFAVGFLAATFFVAVFFGAGMGIVMPGMFIPGMCPAC